MTNGDFIRSMTDEDMAMSGRGTISCWQGATCS